MTTSDTTGAPGAPAVSPLARVLIVDDEHDMLEILQDFFEGEGYAVVVADSGERALEAIQHDSFDVALTDLRMPGIGGLPALLQMKRLVPRLPIIVVTGYASDETERQCRRAGAFECVQKPVDLDDLLRLVTAALAT